ncbi:MAG: hypothetical protein HZB70_03910 [Candidatus Berkelbacteria bacterium]|nr:MAG: hypothetical protein HZB70_03910 [Candidatus Berkelbacteria bacterium]QQG51555.1 MAG: hypothetical protein HY845_03280 [Candidatus Berkelbacteria bacterium]
MGFWQTLFGSKPKRPVIDWLEIESRMRQIDALAAQNNQLAFKQAIIDYDKLIDSLMREFVKADTFADRLKALRNRFPKQLYSQLWKAHLKRNELVHESGSFVAEWEKSTFLRTYSESVSFLRGESAR